MDSATTTASPIAVPDGTQLGFCLAVFYCRRDEFNDIAARLVSEKEGAEHKRRFDSSTGEEKPGEVRWTEHDIRCSLEVAPPFHPLYEARS